MLQEDALGEEERTRRGGEFEALQMEFEAEKSARERRKETMETRVAMAKLATMAFFLNFVPSEPFLTKYLLEEKSVTSHDLDTLVWPTDTYANLLLLLPVGILAERWSYRGTLLLGLLAGQATRLLLLFGSGVILMMLMQVTYALKSACMTVFFAYCLRVAPKAFQGQMSAVIYASYHLGNVFGSCVGQVLVDSAHAPLITLFYISWASQLVALGLFLLSLPSPVTRGQEDEEDPETGDTVGAIYERLGLRGLVHESVQLFRTMESEGLQWCIWWVFCMGGYFIFGNWYQELILFINKNAKFGLIEIGFEFAQAVGAALSGMVSVFLYDLVKLPDATVRATTELGIILFVTGGIIFLDLISLNARSSKEASLGISLRMLLFGFANAYAQAIIAKSAKKSWYAVIFTWNSFLALCGTSILTAVGAAMGWPVAGWFRAQIGLSALCIATLLVLHTFAFGSFFSWFCKSSTPPVFSRVDTREDSDV